MRYALVLLVMALSALAVLTGMGAAFDRAALEGEDRDFALALGLSALMFAALVIFYALMFSWAGR